MGGETESQTHELGNTLPTQAPEVPMLNPVVSPTAGDVGMSMKESVDKESVTRRKTACFDLALDFLQQTNSHLSRERLKEMLLSTNVDIFQAPWQQIYDSIQVKLGQKDSGVWNFGSFDRAAEIAKYYSLNQNIPVPDKVVFFDEYNPAHSQEQIQPGEKALIYINEFNYANRQRKNKDDIIAFKRQRAVGGFLNKRTVELKLPDVFVARIDDEERKFPRYRFSLSGVDNLIIGGKLQSSHNHTVKVSCEGNCAILPQAEIGIDTASGLSLKVDGDITQYGGTNCASKISCHSYIQEGGEFAKPRQVWGSSKNELKINGGKYDYRNGKRADPQIVEITGDVEEQTKRSVASLEREAALLHSQQSDLSAEIPRVDDLDRNYNPHNVGERKEADNSITEIRTYILHSGEHDYERMEQLLKLEFEAKKAGWNIERVEQMYTEYEGRKKERITGRTIGILVTRRKST